MSHRFYLRRIRNVCRIADIRFGSPEFPGDPNLIDSIMLLWRRMRRLTQFHMLLIIAMIYSFSYPYFILVRAPLAHFSEMVGEAGTFLTHIYISDYIIRLLSIC